MSNTFNDTMIHRLANRGKNPKTYKVMYVRGQFTKTEELHGTWQEVTSEAATTCYGKYERYTIREM